MLSTAVSILLGCLRSLVLATTAFPQLIGSGFAYSPSTVLITISGTTLPGFFNCTLQVGQTVPGDGFISFNGALDVVDTTKSQIVTVAGKGGNGSYTSIITPGMYFFAVPAGDSFVVQTTTWTSGTAPVNLLCPYQRPT